MALLLLLGPPGFAYDSIGEVYWRSQAPWERPFSGDLVPVLGHISRIEHGRSQQQTDAAFLELRHVVLADGTESEIDSATIRLDPNMRRMPTKTACAVFGVQEGGPFLLFVLPSGHAARPILMVGQRYPPPVAIAPCEEFESTRHPSTQAGPYSYLIQGLTRTILLGAGSAREIAALALGNLAPQDECASATSLRLIPSSAPEVAEPLIQALSMSDAPPAGLLPLLRGTSANQPRLLRAVLAARLRLGDWSAAPEALEFAATHDLERGEVQWLAGSFASASLYEDMTVAAPGVAAVMESDFMEARRIVARALRERAAPGTMDLLALALYDDDREVQYHAIIGLYHAADGKRDAVLVAPCMELFDDKPDHYVGIYRTWWEEGRPHTPRTDKYGDPITILN